MRLSNEHIHYITKDLHYRGIIAEDIDDELVDHICSAVEREMESGHRFYEAYHIVLQQFGKTTGLQQTQHQILFAKNKNSAGMIKNYLRIAFRSMANQVNYTAINILGLAIGIAACMIITLFLVDELRYDRYHVKGDRIYRLHNENTIGGTQHKMAASPAPVAHALQQGYPEIESTVRLRSYGTYLVKADEGKEFTKEQSVIWADSTFFRIFSVNVIQGNPDKALSAPASAAISKKIADKYFPGMNPVGRTLNMDNYYTVNVTAVYEDIPATSHFHFDIILSMLGDWPVAREARSTVFEGHNFQTYLLLKEGADAGVLEQKLKGFVKQHFDKGGNHYVSSLMPIADIHLHSSLGGELEANSNITYVYMLSAVAFFILLIACINFMNLATARAGRRAKEVGVRKVLGSLRIHLIRQFLMESFLTTTIAFVVALFLAYLALPHFNELASKQLALPWREPLYYLSLLVGIGVIGVLAGSYPSLLLSGFKTMAVLKGRVPSGDRGFFRSALVVFQFVASMVLMVAAITINQQLTFIQNKKLGFDKEQVILIKDAYVLRPNVQGFKEKALSIAGVESCSISAFAPIENPEAARNDRSFWREGESPSRETMVNIQDWRVDFDYVKTLGMTIKQGRDFSIDFGSDSDGVILNEEAVLQFDLGPDPIGKKIVGFHGRKQEGDSSPPTKTWTVIGVAENFHFSSFKESIGPLGLFIAQSDGFVILKLHGSDIQQTIAALEKIWKEMAPEQPFQVGFMDDEFGRMYVAEQRLGEIFNLFAGLAILIACLGLFALSAYTAEQRTKEIGIRKVLGASLNSIVLLLSREFGKLILVAIILSTPLAWYGVNKWLEGYSYKTEIGWAVYVVAGASVLIIAMATMTYQALKAAASDPVKSLRSE